MAQNKKKKRYRRNGDSQRQKKMALYDREIEVTKNRN